MSLRWRVACFDLDGTLVRGTSTCQHLGDCFGHGTVIRDLETSYALGTVTNRDVADVDAKYYIGRTTHEIETAMSTIPLIGGIEHAVSELRRNGILVLLTTVTWSFAAEVLAKRFGLDGCSGCVMGESGAGVLSGTVVRHFDEFDKRDFVKHYCEKRDISMDRVFAVGDSRSDIPLFSAVGHSVAINATEPARRAATCSISTGNLADVLSLIPGFLNSRA